MEGGFWAHWAFNLPNYILAALMWTCFGRFMLGFFLPANSTNYIWRCFVALTDPVIRLVRPITPGFVVDAFMPLVAAFWLIVARWIFWRLMVAAGLAPAFAT